MAVNLLVSRTVQRGTGAALFQVIRKGLPGTEMPPQKDLSDEQIWQVVTYLRGRARPGLGPQLEGNVEAGRAVFKSAGCARCHKVDGEGGYYGPALDSIGASRTGEQILEAIVKPDADVPSGYRLVRAVTKDGDEAMGLLKNSDTFSVQILTRGGEFKLFQRRELAKFERLSMSPMPKGYGSNLSRADLKDLLAYLDRQRDAFVPPKSSFGNY